MVDPSQMGGGGAPPGGPGGPGGAPGGAPPPGAAQDPMLAMKMLQKLARRKRHPGAKGKHKTKKRK